MGVDLNFWKYRSGLYLDNAMVYQKACCDNEKVEGLEVVPIEAILKETAAPGQTGPVNVRVPGFRTRIRRAGSWRNCCKNPSNGS